MSDNNMAAAVAAALVSDWEKAVDINSRILKQNPMDVDCLNRLGKALLEIGEVKKAASVFRKVLKISKYDPIAQRNLERVTSGKGQRIVRSNGKNIGENRLSPASFLEEPGKTKLVNLVNLGPSNILLRQNFADRLVITTKRHTVVVCDSLGNYLGALPDDLAHRLYVLMKGGNSYDGLIKSVSKSGLTVLVRETKKSKKYIDTPSFPAVNSDYLAYLREDVLTPEKEIKTVVEEDDDDVKHKEMDEDEEKGDE